MLPHLTLQDLMREAREFATSEPAAAYLVDAPFEEGAQQLLLFDARESYEMG